MGMSEAQRRVGLAVVLALAVVASGFGPLAGPVAAEPLPTPPTKGPQGGGEVLDDPLLQAPELVGPLGLGGSVRGPLLEQRAGWDDDTPGIAKVPKYTQQDTLGFTWKDNDMGKWKHQKQGPFEFQIDMGDFANKDQLTKNQKGYWLQLLLPTNVAGIQGYFIVDGDGKFDPIDGTYDGIGDEPCHTGKTWDILKVFVNNRHIHTLQGHKERNCGVGETSRVFELIPMTPGEPVNVFRVPVDAVEKGKNTVRIELQDTPFVHPSRHSISPDDGWYIYLVGAAMQLVAPPLVISGGWSFDFPPGGHAVSNSGWEADLANKINGFFVDHFGQSAWSWDLAPATKVNVGTCQQGPGLQSHGVAEYTLKGILIVAKDGKQDFRVSGCEVARMIRDAEGTLGYGYHRGKDPVGFWYIGFSMGGLIGRWAFQREGLGDELSKFVTLGTPHQGSHWADGYTQIMDAKGRYRDVNGDGLRKWWGGWKDWANNNVQARFYENNDWKWLPPTWVGSGALLDHRADFELKRWGNDILDGLQVGAGALAGKTLAVSGQGGTMAGNVASVLTSHPAVKLVGLAVEGDGVVPTDSATNGGMYRAAFCPAVHHGGVYTYFDSCIMPAFEHFTGFLGASAALEAQSAERVIPTAEVAMFAHEITPDLVTGQASTEDEVLLERTPWALFTALWPDDAELRFTLVSPGGQEYTPENATALGAGYNLEPGLGLQRALWVVPDAPAGTWKVRLAATEDTPAWGTAALVRVHGESTVQLVAEAPDRVDPGAPALLTARLTGLATDVAIDAHVLPADETLSLRDDGLDGDAVAGDGVFTLRYVDTAEHGHHQFDLTAQAKVQGQDVVRTTRATVLSAERRDLAVSNLQVDQQQVWWGEAAKATVTVTNTGVATLDDITLLWTDDSDNIRASPLQTRVALGALAPGASQVIALDWMPTPGLRTLVAEAYTSGIEESLGDNVATAAMDVLPSPRTAAHVTGPQGLGGWITGPAQVRLAPFDGDPAPPWLETRYRLDGGAWVTYRGPFQVEGDGVHALEFHSIDLQGRMERVRSATLAIDATAPTAGIAKPVLGINVAGVSIPAPVSRPVVVGIVEVVALSSDATSGVAKVQLRLDGVLVEEVLDPGPEAAFLWDSTTSSTGRHTLTVKAWDHAGLSSEASLQVYVSASRAVQVENNPNALVQRVTPPLG
jgi:hypothetical protein